MTNEPTSSPDSTAANHGVRHAPSLLDGRWSARQFGVILVLAFAAHVALIFIFGARKPIAPLPLGAIPHWHLTDANNELVALSDPTLLARPNAHDLPATYWRRPLPASTPNFDWSESPRFLVPSQGNFKSGFHEFVQQNRPGDLGLDFKPEPDAATPSANLESPIPENSILRLSENLLQRQPQNLVVPPSWTRNDILAPSTIQILVDKEGFVVSAVVLPANFLRVSVDIEADSKALEIARNLRFAPAAQPTMGNLVFYWHTVPVPQKPTTAP